jgi:hypothetical protein
MSKVNGEERTVGWFGDACVCCETIVQELLSSTDGMASILIASVKKNAFVGLAPNDPTKLSPVLHAVRSGEPHLLHSSTPCSWRQSPQNLQVTLQEIIGFDDSTISAFPLT